MICVCVCESTRDKLTTGQWNSIVKFVLSLGVLGDWPRAEERGHLLVGVMCHVLGTTRWMPLCLCACDQSQWRSCAVSGHV